MSEYIVGIDLGTTHTVMAYVEAEKVHASDIRIFKVPQLVAEGQVEALPLLHSLRYHAAEAELEAAQCELPWEKEDASEVVGELARKLGAKVPGRLVASAKSWLSHSGVDRNAAILPWGAPDDVSKVSPVEASASYLRHLKNAWDSHFEAPLAEQQIVLTVPASFDEAARALTLQAAKQAGLPKVRLLEEPQAAFYDWLGRRAAAEARGEASLDDEVRGMHLALVIDVGGGTTDLTLIQVELRESGPRLTRLAVGDHLMLGGDNMDLALAHDVEGKLNLPEKLNSARFSQLVQRCRQAKEALLAEDAPEKVKVTLVGAGRKLIGGAKSADLTRSEVHDRIREGFFPKAKSDDAPAKKRAAIVEFGLPFVADAAITRHVAVFLERHRQVASEAFGESLAENELPIPDAILLNGGVFNGHALSERMLEVLGDWRGAPPKRLENPAPELAVARGAVAYGLARRGIGVRIGGGSPRSYYLVLEDGRSVCLLPRGAEEGEEVRLRKHSFKLRLGEPVRFNLVSSTGEATLHRPGDMIEVGEAMQHLPPLAAVIGSDEDKGKEVDVEVAAGLTEVGTVELSCIRKDNDRRYKLELQLRGESNEKGVERVTQLHPRFAEATELIKRVYGKSQSGPEGGKPVKTLRQDLAKTLGARETWEPSLLRELFGGLLASIKRRRRSSDHERVWFNLAGYCLRPGFGYPLDDWRIEQLWKHFGQSVQFAKDAQNWSEWWTLWRRVAGGLSPQAQQEIGKVIDWYLHPPTKRPRKRPSGPKMQGYDDMVRLAGSLEHVERETKERWGDWLVERLQSHGEGKASWWAIGRLGARVPSYGSAHNVVATEKAEQWLRSALEEDFGQNEVASFAAMLMARRSGDRARDISDELREEVAGRLAKAGCSDAWVGLVREIHALEEADQRRIFGESLPPGLRLETR